MAKWLLCKQTRPPADEVPARCGRLRLLQRRLVRVEPSVQAASRRYVEPVRSAAGAVELASGVADLGNPFGRPAKLPAIDLENAAIVEHAHDNFGAFVDGGAKAGCVVLGLRLDVLEGRLVSRSFHELLRLSGIVHE